MGQDEGQSQVAEGHPGVLGDRNEGLDGVELGHDLGTLGVVTRRHPAGPSPFGQRGVLAVAAGEPAAVQGAPDDGAHPVALTGREHLGLDATGQDRIGRLLADETFTVPALGHPLGLDDEVAGEGGRPEGPDLALVDEVGECPQGVVDVARRIGTVDLVEVDPVRLQAAQAGLDLADDPPARVTGHVGVGPHRSVELGGQHHVLPPASGQSLGHDLLGLAGGVHIGRVDEVDTGIESGVDDTDAVVVITVPPSAEHHGPQAQGGDVHSGVTQRSEFHGRPLFMDPLVDLVMVHRCHGSSMSWFIDVMVHRSAHGSDLTGSLSGTRAAGEPPPGAKMAAR